MEGRLGKIFTVTLVVLIASLANEGIVSQTIFEINNFNAHSDDLQLLGSATYENNILRLTPSEKDKAGACWFKAQKIDLSQGFYMDFEFRISGRDLQHGGGDGFALVIQNQALDTFGGIGDKLGYQNIPYALAIEIDTYNNEEGSKNNVTLSIYDTATGEYIPYATVHEIPEVNDGNSHYARMEYKEGEIVFYLDSYIFPILTVAINLDSLVNAPDGHAWVGFTAATSSATANHDLLSWSLTQYVAPPVINVSDININQEKTIFVHSRKLEISIWDDNVIDGDTISLKIGKDWLLSGYPVVREKKVMHYTLRGFETELVLYAHNNGQIPPNTAAILIDDGLTPHRLKLSSNLTTAESIKIKYRAKGLKNWDDD